MSTEHDHEMAGGVDSQTIDRLVAEFSADDGPSTTTPEAKQQADRLLADVLEGYLLDPTFQFDEATVKANLEEILLTLVAHRSAETNGKRLMEDLSRVFDADLSPGTVYPQLHDFTESGLLEQHELVRTKEYQVADEATVTARLESKMRQHLVLGLFYHRALEEF